MSATKTPDAVEVASRLRLIATRLARRLRQEADTGLSPSQLSALATIEVHGPITLGALAEHERVAPPSVTKAVARLREAGLIDRQLGATDRRVSMISITAAGKALLAKSRHRKTTWLASRLGKLSDVDRARVADALDALDALLAQEGL